MIPSFLISAGIGALVWLLLLLAPLDMLARLFLLAPLVIVPLGLRVAIAPDRHGHFLRPYRLAQGLQLPAALAAVASVFLPQGLVAAGLALPWLAMTLLCALCGLSRFLPRAWHRPEEIAIDTGLVYIAIGGGWFLLSRLGAQPLHFSDTIVLLTAVHFHFAAFAAPILVGMTGRVLAPQGWFYWILVLSLAASIPALALGISFSPGLELLAAFTLAGTMALFALYQVFALTRLQHRPAQILLAFSSCSLIMAMGLAGLYALGEFQLEQWVDIPHMALWHGSANAFGFALGGLAAWNLVLPPSRGFAAGIPFSRLSSQGPAGARFFQRIRAVTDTRQAPTGLVDNLEEYQRPDLNIGRIHPDIRTFYEHTERFGLVVQPEWRAGFRLGGRLYRKLADALGQMCLPVEPEGAEITSEILPLSDHLDGRKRVRAWVRTYAATGQAVYVAAYSSHALGGETYMNIAFPLLGGNVTSILHLAAIPSRSGEWHGLELTTRRDAPGDEGIYFVSRWLPIRLPLDETIRVWSADMLDLPAELKLGTAEGQSLMASHDMWVFGVRFLTLRYYIYPLSSKSA